MMSRFAYLSFKDVRPGYRLRFARLLLIPLVIIVVAIEPPITIFALATVYAFSGPVYWLWRRHHRRHIGGTEEHVATQRIVEADER
jgi:CDP-diacylglycerol--serine O-phosphatidyltransferase